MSSTPSADLRPRVVPTARKVSGIRERIEAGDRLFGLPADVETIKLTFDQAPGPRRSAAARTFRKGRDIREGNDGDRAVSTQTSAI